MDDLKKHIMASEGKSLKLYRDTSERTGFEGKKGKLTIGWGYNIDDLGLPEDICMILLDRKIEEARSVLAAQLPWTDGLDSVRRDVLIDMLYNMGWPTFSAFKATLSAIERGEYEEASQHMLDSLWARQVGVRAKRLAETMKTGASN